MDTVVQIVIAIAIPVGWGLLSSFLYDRVAEHRARRRKRGVGEAKGQLG